MWWIIVTLISWIIVILISWIIITVILIRWIVVILIRWIVVILIRWISMFDIHIYYIRYNIMWSTRKILVNFYTKFDFCIINYYQLLLTINECIQIDIFHLTRQVSPDFYVFHKFWKEKKGRVSPTHTTKLFGFWYSFTFFDYISTKNQILSILLLLILKHFFQ